MTVGRRTTTVTGSKRERLLARRARLEERLKLYLDFEHDALSGADRKNNIGARGLERYDMKIEKNAEVIKKLEEEIDAIDALLDGDGARKTAAVVLRDW